MNSIVDVLNRRYATKSYNPTKKVSDNDLQTILEAMRLSPSSYGLQPWKFIVVTNIELREKLKAASYGQSAITDASHIVVLAVKKDINEKDINNYIESIAATRNISLEALDGFKNMMIASTRHFDQVMKETWNTKQVYIALGVGLVAAASLSIDATPMEGFNASTYNELLGLTDYATAVVMPIGYRSESDETQHQAKVRFNPEQVIEFRK